MYCSLYIWYHCFPFFLVFIHLYSLKYGTQNNHVLKNALGGEERRRKHCTLAVVRRCQKFRPAADPLPGAQDGQNLISWISSLPLPTNPVWWGSMHAISSYRGNRPTKTTNRQGRLQYTMPQLSTQCNNIARTIWMTHYSPLTIKKIPRYLAVPLLTYSAVTNETHSIWSDHVYTLS